MKEYQKLYKNFLSEYIEKNSKYKLKDRVNILIYAGLPRHYVISDINVGKNGEFIYSVTSPRSDSTFPKGFSEEELSLYEE